MPYSAYKPWHLRKKISADNLRFYEFKKALMGEIENELIYIYGVFVKHYLPTIRGGRTIRKNFTWSVFAAELTRDKNLNSVIRSFDSWYKHAYVVTYKDSNKSDKKVQFRVSGFSVVVNNTPLSIGKLLLKVKRSTGR